MKTRAQAIASGIRYLPLSYQGDGKESFTRSCNLIAGEVEALGEAVAEVHAQTQDDRCHLDLAVMFIKFGLDVPDMTMPPKPEFLTSCNRFYDKCTTPGGKRKPGQLTMRELEDRVAELERDIETLLRVLDDAGDLYAEEFPEIRERVAKAKGGP